MELIKYGIGTTIREAIQNALKYKISHYTIENAEYYKQKYEELGSFKKIVQALEKRGEPVPFFETIPKQLKKLFKEKEYLKIFGEKGYQDWFNKNTRVIIDNQTLKIKQLNILVYKEACKVVIQLLIMNSDDIEDSFILERLKKYFNEAGTIDESGINHLAFGRISYLLNHPNYQKIIINHFKLLIEFVRKLISKKKLNESIDPLSINQELNLQLGSTKINELVSYLMREFPKIFSNKLK